MRLKISWVNRKGFSKTMPNALKAKSIRYRQLIKTTPVLPTTTVDLATSIYWLLLNFAATNK